MENKRYIETTSASLHIMGMIFMLCDHLWATVIPGNDWLTCIGRLAFPIFAFMTVEGYFHTKNLKKYAQRLFFFAVLSEIPFNLVVGSSIFYPVYQNVLWSFLISLGLIHLNEKVKDSSLFKRIATGALSVALGFILGLVTMVDYYHAGIFTVLTFYFFRRRTPFSFIGQFLFLWYINAEMLGGFGYDITLFGSSFFLPRQALALFSLIPIWLYHGKKGYHSKTLQYAYYAFYPLHLLILGILKMI